MRIFTATVAAFFIAATPALATSPGRDGRIVFAGTPGIVSVTVNGNDPQTISPTGSQPHYSADGKTIAWYEAGTAEIVVADAAGQRRVAKASNLFALMPDGKSVLITRNVSGGGRNNFPLRPDLLRVDVATGKEKLIAYDVTDPAIAPNGKTVAFVDNDRRNKQRYHSIATVGIDGKGRKVIYVGDAPSFIDWSPDGKSVVFNQTACGGDCSEIRMVTVKTGKSRSILRGSGDSSIGGGVSFSPSGKWLVGGRWDGKSNYNLIRIAVKSRKVAPVGSAKGAGPTWAPGG